MYIYYSDSGLESSGVYMDSVGDSKVLSGVPNDGSDWGDTRCPLTATAPRTTRGWVPPRMTPTYNNISMARPPPHQSSLCTAFV